MLVSEPQLPESTTSGLFAISWRARGRFRHPSLDRWTLSSALRSGVPPLVNRFLSMGSVGLTIAVGLIYKKSNLLLSPLPQQASVLFLQFQQFITILGTKILKEWEIHAAFAHNINGNWTKLQKPSVCQTFAQTAAEFQGFFNCGGRGCKRTTDWYWQSPALKADVGSQCQRSPCRRHLTGYHSVPLVIFVLDNLPIFYLIIRCYFSNYLHHVIIFHTEDHMYVLYCAYLQR